MPHQRSGWLCWDRGGGDSMPDLLLAYIDPGSGSLIIQVIIASIIAIPVIFRNKIAQVANAVRGNKASTEAPDDDPATG